MRKVEEFWVDKKTGEVIKQIPGVFIPATQLESFRSYNQFKEEFQKQGEFVWLLYKKAEELDLKISSASLTRLVYLSTFMDYENYIIDDKKLDDPGYVAKSKEDIKNIMLLPDRTFRRFYNEVVGNDILQIDRRGFYYLNDIFFKRGKLDKAQRNHAMRLYKSGIRSLYCKADISEHKMLGLAFMILPYVNVEYNILCTNPDEKNLKKVNRLGIDDMLKLLGYDKTHLAKYRKSLMKVAVNGYQIINIVNDFDLFVSPNIYYAGHHRSEVMVLGHFDRKVSSS